MRACDPVGAVEIAKRASMLGYPVETGTVRTWLGRRHKWEADGQPDRRRREQPIPAPRWTVNGSPAWDWWQDILPWLVRTGRIPAEKQYLTPWAA